MVVAREFPGFQGFHHSRKPLLEINQRALFEYCWPCSHMMFDFLYNRIRTKSVMHIERANKIIEYIHVNGGSIASAARALDLLLTPRTRAAVLELDPEIERFRYAFKCHNN